MRGWAHLLAEEIGGLPGARVQRRAAMAAVRLSRLDDAPDGRPAADP
jgi:hypothetical protein